MEQPYTGRATIQDNFTELQITIPAKREWGTLFITLWWLCIWVMGELYILSIVTRLFSGNLESLPILFFLLVWTYGGFFAFKTFLWYLIGKEVITVGQNRLTIDKKGALLYKPKVYDLNEVKGVRVQDENEGLVGRFGIRRNDIGAAYTGGTIRFDYGLKTVKFASGIDEAEAKFILHKLKERRFLTDKNYS